MTYTFTDRTITANRDFEFTSGPTFGGDALSGTATGATTVNRTVTGTIAPIVTTVRGCTNSNADNYNSAANEDDGSCYISIAGHDGGDSTAACDNANANTNDQTIYHAPGGSTFYTDTGLTSTYTGWFSADGSTFTQYSNGIAGSTGSCPAPVRIGRASISAPSDVTVAIPFDVTVSASNIVGVGSVTIAISGGGISEQVSSIVSNGSTSHTFEVELTDENLAGQTITISATVSSGSTSRGTNTGNITVNDSF